MKSINSKREQFRKDIIKKQKEEFFNQRRQELLRGLQCPEGIVNPVEELRQRTKVKEAFQYLKKKINESDYFVNIVRFVDEGLINVLMSFLREGKEIVQTLGIINEILIKPQRNYYATFYNYGILEYVFNYFQVNRAISVQCMHILFNFTGNSDDYAQALILNGKHNLIMQELMNRINVSRNSEEENRNEGENYYTITLFVLEHLIRIKESTIDITEEKLSIFRFIMNLVERRLFLKQTIGILYECASELNRTTDINRFILPLVNTLLSQAKTEDKHIYNLYALIYVMMQEHPIDLNFPQFFKTGILIGKVQKPFVLIIGKIVGYGKPYCHVVPTNEEWWERLLMSPQSNNIHCQMLKIIENLDIRKSWVWKIYSAALTDTSLQVQNEAIMILNRLVRTPGFEDMLTCLHLHRIPAILENLTHSGKSQSLKDSANTLLEYILGPLTDQSPEETL